MLDRLKQHIINAPGWRTKRKIVVFESDDWGMVRMRDLNAYQSLREMGYPVNHCPYSTFDHLERADDVQALAELLTNTRNENPPVFTLNNIVANPDFEKIKKDDFQRYSYVPFTETSSPLGDSSKLISAYKEGIAEQVFDVQFHGREHVNINRWITALQNGDKRFKDAYLYGMYTIPSTKIISGRRDYLDSMGRAYENEFQSEESILESGIRLFEKIWGKTPTSFIATCYVWDTAIEVTLANLGIKSIQGTHVQRIPKPGLNLKIKKRYHYMGQRNRWGQRYLVRNAHFEPTAQGANMAVENALRSIDLAFKYRKPAIVSTHRVNYMGGLVPQNRDTNLKLLKRLIDHIIQKYPDVVFMSSAQLTKEMNRD